jgi:hypothetical protein
MWCFGRDPGILLNFYLTGEQISSEDNFRLADELEVARFGQP